ncbi:MAG: BPL-N domain-containing protein [Candidatus Thorarchaeota archaeon SMTZ1-83]|nr:MAG: hypothetical protein AM324_04960 [Candidatus Thorarchaeota archaeon SMTZ1-83]
MASQIPTSYRKPIIAVILVIVVTASALIIVGTPTGMEGVRVAVYDGGGVQPSSKDALDSMFAWMRTNVGHVNETSIREGALADYDILVIPGGGGFEAFLQNEGMDAICQFVEDGGSYFGICGGATFATDVGLRLYNGTYHSCVAGIGQFLMEMNVNRSSTGPDLSGEPESYSIFYWNSGHFSSDGMSGTIPIVTYPDNDLPCMIAFKYGAGRVFLSSPHPEFEEGSNRDGVTYFDALSDPDSEWGLLLKVCRWLIQASDS